MLATRSRLYPDTENVMGWEIGSGRLQDRAVGRRARPWSEKYLGEDVSLFLAEFGLTTSDITTWVCHPGGPKVIEAVESVLELPEHRTGPHPGVVARQRESVVGIGAGRAARQPGGSTPRGRAGHDDRDGPGVLLRARAVALVGACTTC